MVVKYKIMTHPSKQKSMNKYALWWIYIPVMYWFCSYKIHVQLKNFIFFLNLYTYSRPSGKFGNKNIGDKSSKDMLCHFECIILYYFILIIDEFSSILCHGSTFVFSYWLQENTLFITNDNESSQTTQQRPPIPPQVN